MHPGLNIEGLTSWRGFCFVISFGERWAGDHCPVAAQLPTMVTEPSNRGGLIVRARFLLSWGVALGGGWVIASFVFRFFFLSICFFVLLSFFMEGEGIDWIKVYSYLSGINFSDGHRCCLHVLVGIHYRDRYPKLCLILMF